MKTWLKLFGICVVIVIFGCTDTTQAANESSVPLKLTMSIDNIGKQKEIASTLKIVLFFNSTLFIARAITDNDLVYENHYRSFFRTKSTIISNTSAESDTYWYITVFNGICNGTGMETGKF